MSQLNNQKDNTITQSRSLPPQLLTNNINNEHINDVQEIIAEYERRLHEQVALARQDILHELEVHIKEVRLLIFINLIHKPFVAEFN